ncbi:carboxypeptidase-like regulatory domain-containing protein [Tenacibaculum jejuense]|uniref:CarboxypepD_reg-like domain-containing protein n=1 Tax=Tenacibaculum jejuense TaxID=584609 RepID=A0A238U8J8_9FLAO|nr:carboxypeptidase-like regulatory domain-containing protein [Tenacibaculum jejuense]SNR15432.1 conserved protein of unknown function [Tenacibaculum jejuense]
MKNKITLDIEKPCSKKFSDFTKTELGGLCDSCHKQVIDFTGMTSQEIIHYFKNNSKKKTCGQFSKHQLSTTITAEPTPKKPYLFKTLGLMLLSLFSINHVDAQQAKAAKEVTSIQIKTDKTSTQKRKFSVKGTVSDDSGPLPGVSVHLEGTVLGTETDFDGHFSFPEKLKEGDVLIFSFVGMETKKVIIKNEKSASTIEMKINIDMANCNLIGEVSVKKVFSSKKKLWKKTPKK